MLNDFDCTGDLWIPANVRLAIMLHMQQSGFQCFVDRRRISILQQLIVAKDQARLLDWECEVEVRPLQLLCVALFH